MAENVVFTGMAKAPEKRTLVTLGKEKLRTSFTPAGVEEVWRKKHAKEIQELTTINASLSDEDRAKAMEKLEKDIKRAVVVKVAGNYGAAALVTTAVVGEGLLIGNYKGCADKLADKRFVGGIGRQAKWAKRGIDKVIGMAQQFRTDMLARAEELRAMDELKAATERKHSMVDALSGGN